MMLLEGKICIVTGAARGIGKAIAKQLATDGGKVYACDLNESDLNWCSDYNDSIIPLRLDVTDNVGVKSALLSVFKKEGKIDVLVNNAAIISNQKIGMITHDELQRMFAVNVIAVIECIQTVSRLMLRTGGGSIINMASITGLMGSPGQTAYSSTKGAVISLTKSAANNGDKIEDRINKIGLGRLGTPEDIANLCSFLASDKAGYISGQIIGVDGCATI